MSFELSPISVTAAGRTLQAECFGASHSAGWWTFNGKHDPLLAQGTDLRIHVLERTRLGIALANEKLTLIHSELSEALEGVRKDKMDDHLPHRKSVEVELADAVIRIFDLAGAMQLDLGAAIAEKMAYNAQRPDHKAEARAAAGGKAF